MIMKRTGLLLAIFAMFVSAHSNGQVIQSDNYFGSNFGVHAGLSYAMMDAAPFKPQFNPGFFGGIYKSYHRGNNGFRIELNASQGHFVTERPASYVPGVKKTYLDPTVDTVQKGDFNTFYVRIPILGEFKVYKSLYFLFGPEYCMQMSIKDNNGAFTTDYGNNGGVGSIFKSGGLMGDVGLHVVLKQRIVIGTRLSVGLTSLNKEATNAPANNFRDYGGWKLWSSETFIGFNILSND